MERLNRYESPEAKALKEARRQLYEEAKLEEEQNRPKFDQKAAAAKAAAEVKANQRE